MKPIKHFVLMAALITSSVISLYSSKGIAAEYTLRYGHVQALDHPHHKAALYFADKLQKATSNRVEVKIFPAAQIGANGRWLNPFS